MNVLITGASGGVGKAIAQEFIKTSSHNLFLVSRNEALLHAIKEEAGIEKSYRVHVFPFDLITGDYVALKKALMAQCKGIDILINNAGAIVNKPFEDITFDEFDTIINTNYKGPFFLIQHLLPLMNEGAHIINISSMGGVMGSVKFPGLSLYSSSKGALSILTECLAVELAPRKISVNCLAPGSVQTSMLETAFPGYQAQTTSESIAEFIVLFATTGNRWMNGKVIPLSVSTP